MLLHIFRCCLESEIYSKNTSSVRGKSSHRCLCFSYYLARGFPDSPRITCIIPHCFIIFSLCITVFQVWTLKEKNQLNLVRHTFPSLDIIVEDFCLFAFPYFNLLFVISITTHLETPFPWLLIPLELMAVSQILTSSLLFAGMFLGRQSRKQKTSISFPWRNF